MLKYSICFLFFTFLSCAGENGQNETPENILDEDKMISVLIDLHIADSVLELEKTPKDSAAIKLASYQDQILQKHNVEKTKYEKTLKYYKNNPAKFEKLYEKLLQKMNIMESELNK